MRVLVTGGTGFIGTCVVEELDRRGIAPVVMDRNAHAVGENVHPEFETIYGDVRDASLVSEAVYHTDAVIHLAATLGTQETIKDPRPAAETNVLGSLNVFQAASLRGVRAVYIAVGNHWMNNPYSISKTCAERFAYMFNRETGSKIAVVRALNAYGPRQKAKPVRKIMPNLVLPALERKPIQVYGDGEQVMDMIHVEDVARVLVEALLVDHDVYDSAFSAGSGVPTTVNQVAEAVIAECERQGLVADGLVEHLPMRPGEPPNSVVVGDPLTLAPLGIRPQDLIRLEDGLKNTVAYYARGLNLSPAVRTA